jgi:hypothetical protein
MSKFVVNPESLEVLQKAVIGLALELEHGSAPTPQFASSSTPYNAWQKGIHGGELAGAEQVFDPFFAAWTASLGQIGQNIENVAKALVDEPTDFVKDHFLTDPASKAVGQFLESATAGTGTGNGGG